MTTFLIAYLIGAIVTFYCVIKRVIVNHDRLLVADLAYTLLLSLGSWMSWIIVCDEALDLFSSVTKQFTKVGNKTVWQKKDKNNVTTLQGKQ